MAGFCIFVALIKGYQPRISLWHIRNAGTVPIGAVFYSIPDLAVFRRFPGISPLEWYKLSSAP